MAADLTEIKEWTAVVKPADVKPSAPPQK